MRLYQKPDSKPEFVFDRAELTEMWEGIIRAAEYDPQSHAFIDFLGLWAADHSFNWTELWRRDDENERERAESGWKPLPKREQQKFNRRCQHEIHRLIEQARSSLVAGGPDLNSMN
jgi:hypothetical protein